METGLVAFWAQADAVGKSAAVLLLAMSVLSWYLIVWKSWHTGYTRRYAGRAIDAFWESESEEPAGAVAQMQLAAPGNPFTEAATESVNAAVHHMRHSGGKISGALNLSDFITRALRRTITRATSRLESGLSVLASIGATAPFIGLFGTVWGIYHALISIGFTGEATIDKVAGPVGEALIMTAFGIAVAVPAVLGYNFCTRANRVILAELDAFAHDLHAYLTTGAKLPAAIATVQPRNV
ncbi:MAG TPA: MotA/TolQ/ExbB proton channel family protein [Gammaproteobacteria bacterium]